MKIRKALAVIFICISCLTTKAFSQYPALKVFKSLNVTDGLPQSFISGVVQDRTGFVWIGTRDGLARYDGKKFKVFRHVQGESTSLANNTIIGLYLDKQSRLWITFETGAIDVLDTKTELLLHFTKDKRYAATYGMLKSGRSIAEDDEGNIWMLDKIGGIFVCNLNKQTKQHFSAEALGLLNNKIAGITANKGDILLITDTALVTVDADGKTIENLPYTFSNPHLYDSSSTWRDRYAVVRKNGEVIILDAHCFIIYRPATNTFSTVLLPEAINNLNQCMTADSKGNVFFDCNGSIYVLSINNKINICKPKDKSAQWGYKSMLVDKSGVLWLGGNASGIQLCDLRLAHWLAIDYERSFPLDVFNKFLYVPEPEIKKSFLYDMQAFRFRWAGGVDGRVWFSKAVNDPVAKSPLCYYKRGHIVTPRWHYTDTVTKAHINISAIAASQSGKVWGIDFFFRPVYFDTVSLGVTVYPSIASINFDEPYTVNSLVMDGEDIFWITTALEGLWCYNKQNNIVIHYFAGNSAGALPANQLTNLVQDRRDPDVLWIGSLGSGLIKFNKTTGKCRVFTTADGLPNNTVYAVAPDKRGMLWCSSNKGVFSFHPATNAVRSFTSRDGLPGDEFNRYHFLELPNGNIAFGGVNGYTVFDPLRIADDNFQPEIALTGIRVNNVPADYGYDASPFKSSINSLEEISLPYDQNFLTFEFAALQFNITEKLQYRYRLEGFDNDWVYSGNENIATYTKIPPGHYTLKVNATNTAGKWSDNIKAVAITIKPPFWQTWWFVSICILLAGAVIYFLIKNQIEGVRKEEQQKAGFEREASELKAQALRAQMNPHFIFNCLNSIKALIQEDNKVHAVIYLTTFSKLIRSQLNNAQREVSLYEELQTCRLYAQLESLRFGDKIVCGFEIDEDCDIHSLQVPPLIIQPFIENAIWHGILPKEGGKVTVSVVGDNSGVIKCRIDDNGIGREKSILNKSLTSSTYKSKGMKLVQNRLDLYNIIHNHGGSIEIIDKKDKNNNATGTLVIMKFIQQI